MNYKKCFLGKTKKTTPKILKRIKKNEEKMMSKKTFLMAISLITIVGMISMVSFANAHNPQLVEAWYERNTWTTAEKVPEVEEYFIADTIIVIITHDVTDPDKHYVNEIHIEITRNNSGSIEKFVIHTDPYTYQTNISMNEYHIFAPDLEVGDEIHVTAYSNDPYVGSFSTHMFVGEPFPQHETAMSEAIAPSIIISILLSIPLVIIAKKDSSEQKRAIKSALAEA